MIPKDSAPLLLIPISSQDLGMNLHVQQNLSSLDIFSGLIKIMEPSTPEQGESSNIMDAATQNMNPKT